MGFFDGTDNKKSTKTLGEKETGGFFNSYKQPVTPPKVEPKPTLASKAKKVGGELVKAIVKPVATTLARPVQAVAELAGASAEDVNKTTARFFGDYIAPVPENFTDVKKDVGSAIQTVALGLPTAGLATKLGGSLAAKSAAFGAEGAIFGTGASLEQGNDLFSKETAKQAGLGAVIGGVLPVAGAGLTKVFGKKAVQRVPEIIPENKTASAIEQAAPKVPEVLPTGKVNPEVPKVNTVTKNIVEEFKGRSPGHTKFSDGIDGLVKGKSIFPEEANLIREVFLDTDEKILNSFDIRSNSRLRAVYGRATFTRQYVPKELQMRGGLATYIENNKLSRLPSSTFFHEYAHIAQKVVLNTEDNALISKVFNKMGKEGRTKFFNNSLYPSTAQNNYYIKTEQEFFAQSFADYVVSKKVPEESLRPLFERVYLKLKETLLRILKRGDTPPDELMPIYEKMLSGDKDFTQEMLKSRLAPKKPLVTPQQTEDFFNKQKKAFDEDPEFKSSSNEQVIAKFNEVKTRLSKTELIDIAVGKNPNVPEGLTPTAIRRLMKLEKDVVDGLRFTPEEKVRLSSSFVDSTGGKTLQGTQVGGKIIDSDIQMLENQRKALVEAAKSKTITSKTVSRLLDDLEC